MLIDISQEVFSGNVYPGDPEPVMKRVRSRAAGDSYELTEFSMCTHNGTHIDAPFHFIDDGKTIDTIGLKVFVGDCYVVRFNGELSSYDVVDIMEKARSVDASGRILLAGDAILTRDSSSAFAKANIRLLGVEAQSVGDEEIHKILLASGMVLLEGAVLSDVPEGKYILSAAPLCLSNCDGAPCRAYLIR